MHKIGFMQGRLSPMVNGRIQAFPWQFWQSEFPLAEQIGLGLMEWTLDQDRLYENPLLTAAGQNEIQQLCSRHAIKISSLTGDCFMQAPFWKADGKGKAGLKESFLAICRACATVGIRMVVVPLVDNGRLDDAAQEDELVEFLLSQQDFFSKHGIQVIFESDYTPQELSRFIDRLPTGRFGINYDIGNSAALGFDPVEEFAAYGSRVINVHVKDRVLGGTTVPLKTGAAQFEVVFAELAKANYQGNFILQTARAADNDHAVALRTYRDITMQWIEESGLVAGK